MRFKWRSFCLKSRNDTKRTINWVIEWDEIEMCYRNFERVIPFFDASYTRRSTPCSGYLFKEEMHNRSMLTGQTFQRVTGGLHGVIDTYMVFPDRARANLNQKQQNGVTRLRTTSWTPNFFFWEIFNRVIKPQAFESNVWWVLTLHTNVETS